MPWNTSSLSGLLGQWWALNDIPNEDMPILLHRVWAWLPLEKQKPSVLLKKVCKVPREEDMTPEQEIKQLKEKLEHRESQLKEIDPKQDEIKHLKFAIEQGRKLCETYVDTIEEQNQKLEKIEKWYNKQHKWEGVISWDLLKEILKDNEWHTTTATSTT